MVILVLSEGERAVFLGNSITDGGHYHSYIWLYYMTRFPDMPIRVFNGGIGGDTAYDMNKRLDGDIFAMKPSVLMVTFGMNDSGYFEYNGDKPKEFGEQKYQESIKNYQQMEKRFKDLPDTRIVMVGTSPYDETVQLKENTPFKTKNETIKRDAGNALDTDAVGALTPRGKYLVLLSEAPVAKLADSFGAPFVSALGDICETAALTPESLSAVAKAEFDKLAARAQKALGFTVTAGDAALLLAAESIKYLLHAM